LGDDGGGGYVPIIISRKHLSELLTMKEVIEAVEKRFREYKKGYCIFPVRLSVEIDKEQGVFLAVPGYLEKDNSFGAKIVSVFPGNPIRGLASIHSSYLLHHPTTGNYRGIAGTYG